jgi:hypothetical protein
VILATDIWAAPNHKEYGTITVCYKPNGVPVSKVLDVVELCDSRFIDPDSDFRLAASYLKIFEDTGFCNKVLLLPRRKLMIDHQNCLGSLNCP